MAYIRLNISSTVEFETMVSKFIHSQKLKGKKTNRSELDRNAIELYIENERNNSTLKGISEWD